MKEEKRATRIPQPDLIIGETALHHGLTLVTRDRGDFKKAGVPILNPWDSA
jgi:predicted nucleic acid-binding protein